MSWKFSDWAEDWEKLPFDPSEGIPNIRECEYCGAKGSMPEGPHNPGCPVPNDLARTDDFIQFFLPQRGFEVGLGYEGGQEIADKSLPTYVPRRWERDPLEQQFEQPSGLRWDDKRNSSWKFSKAPKLTILVGIPGCGKSTVTQNMSGTVVSSDEIRKELFGTLGPEAQEPESAAKTFQLFEQRVEEALQRGEDVIADSTGLYKPGRDALTNIARRNGAEVHALVFDNNEQALAQNAGREGFERVPDEAMERMIQNHGTTLENLPNEDFDSIQKIGSKHKQGNWYVSRHLGGQPSGYDPKQEAMGYEVEKEHADLLGNDPKKIMQVVHDHLDEYPDYYTRLKKVETSWNFSSLYKESPFKSDKQRAWMHIHEPEIADKWEEEYEDDPVQPDKKKEKI